MINKKKPNQVIRPPNLVEIGAEVGLACFTASRFLPWHTLLFQGIGIILYGLIGGYLIYALPKNWLKKANENVEPFYRFPKGGKHVRLYFAALVVTIIFWA